MRNRLKLLLCMQSIISFSVLSFSNPLESTPFTEIQIVDSTNWTVEVDFAEHYGRPFPKVSSDIAMFCCASLSDSPPADSFKQCIKSVSIDSNGIGLVTNKHIPSLKMKRGSNLFIKFTDQTYSKKVALPPNLSPKVSLVWGYSSPVCCSYMAGTCVMTCRSLIYIECQCPSLGMNNNACTDVRVSVLDLKDNPLDNVRVICSNGDSVQSGNTIDGAVSFKLYDFCKSHEFKICDLNGFVLSTKSIAPSQPGTIVPLSFNIDLPSAVIPKKALTKTSEIKILSASATGIVFIFSGGCAQRSTGNVELYSTDGKLIRTLLFTYQNSGTYTVKWDGKDDNLRVVPSGMYTVRISIGGESLCTGIVKI